MKYYGQTKTMHETKGVSTAVLLVNLGTPTAPTATALRTYLREFLSDPRVIELPKWKWWPILHGIILRVRPKKSAALYQKVWTDQGSPLMTISLAQAIALQAAFDQRDRPVRVELAMRYGQPDIASTLKAMQTSGVTRVIVLPLYPQYAGATVGATFDALADALKSFRWVPQLHFINTYHDHPLYIQALAQTAREYMAQHGAPQKWLFSYHGMPQRYLDGGDPYYCFCQKTSRLLAEELALDSTQYLTTFQSRFGREPWLQPYTDETLVGLAKDGIRHVAVICPGFSADCLETLEEIAVENKNLFLAAGGDNFQYVPALNARQDHIELLVNLVQDYC